MSKPEDEDVNITVGGGDPPPRRRRVYFSSSAPTSWEPMGYWIDYRVLRSWLRRPIQTFVWWRRRGR